MAPGTLDRPETSLHNRAPPRSAPPEEKRETLPPSAKPRMSLSERARAQREARAAKGLSNDKVKIAAPPASMTIGGNDEPSQLLHSDRMYLVELSRSQLHGKE